MYKCSFDAVEVVVLKLHTRPMHQAIYYNSRPTNSCRMFD